MTELVINIPDEKEALITEMIKELGGNVERKNSVSKKAAKRLVKEKIDSTFMFGKWKNFDIDARKLRDELWTRKF